MTTAIMKNPTSDPLIRNGKRMPRLKKKSVRQMMIEERRLERKLRHMVAETKYSARLVRDDEQPSMIDIFGNPIVFEQMHHHKV